MGDSGGKWSEETGWELGLGAKDERTWSFLELRREA